MVRNELMKNTSIGFIGAGFIAQQCHLPAFKEQSNCCLLGIADPHNDLVQRVASMFEIPFTYSSHKDLIANSEIDAVVITLPRAYTYGVVKDCLQAGKHVFTEKPLTLNHENARKLKKLAQKKKLLLYVGYMKRNDSGIKKFKDMIQQRYSNHKNPLLIKSTCFMGDSYCSPFGSIKSNNKPESLDLFYENFPISVKARDKAGYENFINTYSHVLDSLQYVFTEKLKLIKSNISNKGYGITLFNVGDTPAEISTAKSEINHWFEEIQVVYADEILTINLPPALLKNVPATIKVQKGKDFFEETIIRPKWSWAFLNQAEDFLSRLQKNNMDLSPVESAIDSLKFSLKIFKN